MRSSYDCVIIGGGVSGLAIAYELAKRGYRDVAVLEESYLGSGSTGRCGSGIRAQFTSADQIVLLRESEAIWEHLSEELEYDVHFKACGYLFLWDTPELVDKARQNVAFQNRYGVMSRIIDRQEAKEICPSLNTDSFLAGQWHDKDGMAFPFDTVTGYARAARRQGVDIMTSTRVFEIETTAAHTFTVHTTQGNIETKNVVNAAGPEARGIAAMLNVDLPYRLDKHQIMATEPLEQFLGPMLVKGALYYLQTHRGNVVGGTDTGDQNATDVDSTFEFLTKFAKEATEIVPRLAGVKLMRQWAGYYVMSPDAHPVLGPVDEVPGFFQANGYSGHGFMMGPIVGRLLAEYIADGKPSIDIDHYNFRRFARGELLTEKAVIG
ncbi:MAG: FAD-binding oxidoreductase [Candidatus Cryosericum sp.]